MRSLSSAVAASLLLSVTRAAPATEAELATFEPRNENEVSCTYSNNGYWVAPVNVGGSKLNLKVDTGSCDTLVTKKDFTSSIQGSGGSAGSAGGLLSSLGSLKGGLTSKGGLSWAYNFASGFSGKGSVYSGDVQCGGVSVPSMSFGSLTSGSSGSVGADFDGVMGMGFKGASAISPTKQSSFAELVTGKLSQPIFSCNFQDNSPSIAFGSINKSLFQGNLLDFKCDKSSGQWSYAGMGVSAGGAALGSGKCGFNFDTTASSIYVTAEMAEAYWKLVKGSCQIHGSGWAHPCSACLPDLELSAAEGAKVTVPGWALAGSTEISGHKGFCSGGLQVSSSGSGSLGLPFFKSHYCSFNSHSGIVSAAPYKSNGDKGQQCSKPAPYVSAGGGATVVVPSAPPAPHKPTPPAVPPNAPQPQPPTVPQYSTSPAQPQNPAPTSSSSSPASPAPPANSSPATPANPSQSSPPPASTSTPITTSAGSSFKPTWLGFAAAIAAIVVF